MLSLNKFMASIDVATRRLAYNTLSEGGIERVLDKVRKTLQSVAVEKEIEIFHDDVEMMD